MDCFKSGRDWLEPPGVPVVLAGLGGAVGSVPKKSKPRRESFVLVVFGGAGSAFGGIFVAVGPAVLDLCGIGSPPMRSACGGAAIDRGAADWPTDAFRSDSLRSTTCFSFTTLSGISSSPSASNVEGSGIGPSITHLLSSYLVRMKFSILASEGTWPGASFASQYLFARAFPQLKMLCSCSSVQESRSTDLTRLMCVPIPRWMPEHRMQTKTPRFQEAHRGSAQAESIRCQAISVGIVNSRLLRLQSAHTLLGSNFKRLLIVCWFWAARSAAGFGGRRDMVVNLRKTANPLWLWAVRGQYYKNCAR